MKKYLWMALTVGLCLAGLVRADEGAVPLPVAVLESESFEAVGRLKAEGFSWYIDQADSNAPVLGAAVDIESGGRSVKAVFRPETGDYWVADEAWLKPLRAAGHHPLALTVIAGQDSDLLAGELHVEAGDSVSPGRFDADWRWVGLAVSGLLVFVWLRRKRGGAV